MTLVNDASVLMPHISASKNPHNSRKEAGPASITRTKTALTPRPVLLVMKVRQSLTFKSLIFKVEKGALEHLAKNEIKN